MVMIGRCSRQSTSSYRNCDNGNSDLDCNRARSDESLFWAAGEEAAVIVAELQASLTPSASSVGVRSSASAPRSHSYTNLSSLVALDDLPHVKQCHQGSLSTRWNWSSPSCSTNFIPPRKRNHFYNTMVHPKRPLFNKPPKFSSSVEVFHSIPTSSHFPRGKSQTLRTFGGSWKSLIKLSTMSARAKNGGINSAKKVAPPTVPEGGSSSSSASSCSSSSSSHRHSGSSYSSGIFSADQRSSYSSSIGEEGQSLPPPSPSSPGRDSGCDPAMTSSISSTGSSNGSLVSANSSSSSVGHRLRSSSIEGKSSPLHHHSHQQNGQFNFPNQAPQFAHLMCSKSSHGSPHHIPHENVSYPPYQPPYTQQVSMEDQGIDVQSPGRSSPGSGSNSSTSCSTGSSERNCRNSTTSLDSGRASSSTQTQNHRLSGHSYDSSSVLRHSYHSSSSSIGSSIEFDSPLQTNAHELLSNGVPDDEVLRLWLTELRMEEYLEKFLSAGYDMPTISRMTPEDLNAIGITSPIHRKKLKAEISRLNISDCLPNFIPSRLEEWLSLLRLEQYIHPLKNQNYNTVQQATQITWEDLEDVGIRKLGHQKKVMLAIKRVKDIMAGKKIHQEERNFPLSIYNRQDLFTLHSVHTSNPFYLHNKRIVEDPGGIASIQFNNQSTLHPAHLSYLGNKYFSGGYYKDLPRSHLNPVTVCYRPDVVTVNSNRNGNVHYAEEPLYGTCQTFLPASAVQFNMKPQLSLQSNGFIPRSYDDGDITPTNESAGLYESGGGTLPRPRNAAKYRPVAKVTAKTRVDVHEIPSHILKQESLMESTNDKTYPSDSANTTPTPTPISTPKKMPPPPPKRSHSLTENSSHQQSCQNECDFSSRGVSYSYIGVQSNLQPDFIPDMPPPPPAPQDRGNHQHHPEDFPPPPPPLTCISMTTATRNLTSVSSSIAETESSVCNDSESVGFRARRNESNSSFKSTSSSDSGESLPFANDNAGTIRQRPIRPQPHFTPSPHSSPLISRRREGVVHPIVRDTPPSSATTLSSPFKALQTTDGTSDVLSDIGNMLANLTDELDAMLDEEMALKKQTLS